MARKKNTSPAPVAAEQRQRPPSGMVILNGRRIRVEDLDRANDAGKAVAAAGYTPRPLTTRAHVATGYVEASGPAEAVPEGVPEVEQVAAAAATAPADRVSVAPVVDDPAGSTEDEENGHDADDDTAAGEPAGPGDADGPAGDGPRARARAPKGE